MHGPSKLFKYTEMIVEIDKLLNKNNLKNIVKDDSFLAFGEIDDGCYILSIVDTLLIYKLYKTVTTFKFLMRFKFILSLISLSLIIYITIHVLNGNTSILTIIIGIVYLILKITEGIVNNAIYKFINTNINIASPIEIRENIENSIHLDTLNLIEIMKGENNNESV